MQPERMLTPNKTGSLWSTPSTHVGILPAETEDFAIVIH
jgi:hypothetical protein